MDQTNRNMKPLLSMIWLCIVSVFAHGQYQDSEIRNHVWYDWTVSYSTRLSPLAIGMQKQVIVINDQFPGPLLNLTTNDVINVNIHNNLTEPFLMTWNGIQLRRNSWQDGMQETNCPILPGLNWTYSFQLKDQIGSFFYFPSILFHKAAGGYGPIRLNNRDVIPIPFPQPHDDFDLLIGDWYNADHRDLKNVLDAGGELDTPDGILINGLGLNQWFRFETGVTYRLRISNVGLKTSLNFRMQDHLMELVEIEGSYTVKKFYSNLDVHVGQSYSVLVHTKNHTDGAPFYMVVSCLDTPVELKTSAIIYYPDSVVDNPNGTLPSSPAQSDYLYSLWQARTMRLDSLVGSARPNPQGSYHYGNISISRTILLENGLMSNDNKIRYHINGVSFLHPHTPLKLADHFQLSGIFNPGVFPTYPNHSNYQRFLAASVIDVAYRDFVHIVFQNPLTSLQTWHLDGYNFFVVRMDHGIWNETMMKDYNMHDAIWRSTVQVYPFSWTAVLVSMDNMGLWNLRSQNAQNWYLGQELYIRVRGDDPTHVSPNDEAPIPENVIKCGMASSH